MKRKQGSTRKRGTKGMASTGTGQTPIPEEAGERNGRTANIPYGILSFGRNDRKQESRKAKGRGKGNDGKGRRPRGNGCVDHSFRNFLLPTIYL
jgi:hypothetical protein